MGSYQSRTRGDGRWAGRRRLALGIPAWGPWPPLDACPGARRGIIGRCLLDCPRCPVQPGDYAVEWFLADRVISGELSLESGRPPSVALFGDVVPRDWSQERGFPEEHSLDRVVGRLRSNLDVVLTDAHIWIAFPQQSLGSARHAVVGMDVADVARDAFHRSRFQVTNLDLLFGIAPIRSITWPAEGTPPLEGQFSIEMDPEAHHEWADDSAGITVKCTYQFQFPLRSGHQHYVAFAPIVSIASEEPLNIDRWFNEWVMPFLRLAALATHQPQRLSWMTVNTAPRTAQDDERMRSTTGTVFGGGIEQAPYEAEYRDEWREPANRPLFTLATIPMSLPDLVRSWRALERDENPFIELFGLTLRQAELPARARYLYLVQALEALHSYEHGAEEDEAQATFKQRRSEVLNSLREVELSPRTLSFIKDNWSKRRADSLDRRLRNLIDQLPEPVRELLSTPPSGDVVVAMTTDGPQPIEALLRILRNDLSHGNRNYDDGSLRPWVQIGETMCRAHALRLLGFDDEAIVAGLAPPPAPAPPAPAGDAPGEM